MTQRGPNRKQGLGRCKFNLASALLALGQQESGRRGSKRRWRPIARGWRSGRAIGCPLYWAETQQRLAPALAMRQYSAARMEEAPTCILGDVEIYQQSKDDYWLPIAKRRAMEMEVGSNELENEAIQVN